MRRYYLTRKGSDLRYRLSMVTKKSPLMVKQYNILYLVDTELSGYPMPILNRNATHGSFLYYKDRFYGKGKYTPSSESFDSFLFEYAKENPTPRAKRYIDSRRKVLLDLIDRGYIAVE